MLDYDGTLVPYRLDREAAVPTDRSRELLWRLANRPRLSLVICSGRRLAELEGLVNGVQAHFVGEHGWEERTVEGRHVVRAVPGELAKWLGWAARTAREHGWEEHLERKRGSLVLHTRGMEPLRAASIEDQSAIAWAPACRHDGIRLERVDGGLELRAFVRHEGSMVADLLAGSGPETLPVYVGDDLCDEDAFFQLLGRGVAIHVGPRVPASIADYALPRAEDVESFLASWDEATRAA